MEKHPQNPGILGHTQDHPGIPSPIDSYGKYPWNPGIFRHTQDQTGIPSPIDSYGKHPWNPGIFRHQDYPRIPPTIDPCGKVSLESWDIQTYSGSSWDSITHRLLWKISLESWNIQTYSGSSRDSITHRLLWKYPWNPGIFRHTQDHPRIPQSVEPHGKVSSESWDTQTYSGLSQDSTIHRPS